jgi:uncharacterized membrane protein YfcA
MRRLGIAAAAGAGVGAALLLESSDDLFDVLAPWLIIAACAALAARPLIVRGRTASVFWPTGGLVFGVFAGAVYGGYFGAGLGIMLLALLGACLRDDLQRLNALKGLLSLIVAAVAALIVGIFGPVAWGPAGAMAVAALAGGHVGVGIARRLPEPVLRWGIVVYGVGVAIALLG